MDFLMVDTKDQVTLVEVKPFKQTKPPRKTKKKTQKTFLFETKTFDTNSAKWQAAEEYCRVRRWKFLIITEKELGI